ncbi:alginate lyase family protein [Flavobacterium daejeonense]|uniref:alginate lyase family protein n=1 Tax=Flavobacterium daejeonense TaxID=350893 RepID=UPI00047EC2A1|nr:alginate lyase family protein [Flavobacterium daejeonense]
MKKYQFKFYRLLIPILILSVVCIVEMGCSKSSSVEEEDAIITPTPTVNVIETLDVSVPMKHVGGIHTDADYTRVKAKLEAGTEPWTSGWNKLIANSHAQSTYSPSPVEKLIRGGKSAEEPDPDNYSRAMNDVAAAYQLALRWKISGNAVYAQTAVNILNAWASTCTRISGDSNVALAAGIYGYQFAIAGEMLRGYPGWNVNDFAAYQQWMKDVFYSLNKAFLESHWGTCKSHYWANWDLANLTSVLAIGILTDDRAIYNYAINYLQKGDGNGNWYKAINHVFSGDNQGLAQIQESGRDQGHATLCIALMGHICQLTWNQGDDFYGLDNNRFLKACEYTAKYNVARLNVPFTEYTRNYKDAWSVCGGVETHTQVSSAGQGTVRPMWSGPYFHYTKIKKVSENLAKYTKLGVTSTTPEGGGGDYGPNSGGFDQLGFGTLMYTLD